MRVLKSIFFALATIVILLVVIAFILPQHIHVERDIVIAAEPEEVYAQVNNPKSFNLWSPWAKLDPNTQYTYTGPESGTGASMSWASENPNVGSGSWTITDAVDNESIKMDLDFGSQGDATSTFDLVPANSGTRITWGFDMDAGFNPMNRWFGLMMDDWIGAEYEKGLAALKALVEKSQTESGVSDSETP